MADSNGNNPRDRRAAIAGRGGGGRGGGDAGPRRSRRGRGDTTRGGRRGGRGGRDDAGRREGRGGQRGGSRGVGRPEEGYLQHGGPRTETGERGWTSQVPSLPSVLGNVYGNFNNRTVELSAAQINDLLESGLLAVTHSSDSKEEFINNLATESGLVQIKQIVETEFASSYSVLNPMFHPHCTLFLQLISHKEIRYALRLEKAVGTIYNVIYGHDGNRGIGFFRQVAGCLIKMRPEADDKNGSILMEKGDFQGALFVATAALLRTLTLNQGASIKPAFKEIVKQLCDCYCIGRDTVSPVIRDTHENILKIKDILSIGDSISVSSSAAGYSSMTTCQQQQTEKAFPLRSLELEVDLPGEFSKLGPRHDNDHARISEIRILPTISEILSARKEFLPTRHSFSSPSLHHEMGILRLLDTQFRLLREDTSGVLRNSISLILENWDVFSNNPDFRIKRKILRDQSPTPARIYSGVKIQRVKYNRKGGLEVETEFDQVYRVRTLNFGRRQQWWRHSRELREGGPILALIEWDGLDEKNIKMIFLLVAKRDIGSRDHEEQRRSSGIQGVRDLASDAKRAMITLRLASPTYEADQSNLIDLATKDRRSSSPPRPLLLVEFPAVLYNSFEGVLRCLQLIHKDPESIPFTTWLAPRHRDYQPAQSLMTTITEDAATTAMVPAPAYLKRNPITLDLSCILTSASSTTNNNSSNSISLTFSLSQDPQVLSNQLSEQTTLDHGQAVAMVSAFRREVALIQGPPGTGKSFVGIQIARCLLMNRDLLRLGPILCVCYTNHALDQFLHELLASGVDCKFILRMGSRSQYPDLEALSLDNYKKRSPPPRVSELGRRIKFVQRRLDEIAVQIQEFCRQIEEGSTEVVKCYLEKRFLARCQEIFAAVKSGWGDDEAIEDWLSGDIPTWDRAIRSDEELLNLNVWTLAKGERSRLYKYWHCSAFAELRKLLRDLMQSHRERKQQLTSLFHESDKRFLEQAHVVGVTTTGLANNSDLLRGLTAKVLICEEAGEILESHVLTALLPSVQHAILIGDHLQLRPRIATRSLSMEEDKYNLDESLFERLASSCFGNASINSQGMEGKDKFPIAQLDHQRRMDPSISSLVRNTLYPHLHDHPSTTIYPEIPGMRHRLFWLDHRHFEDAGDPSELMQSKTNDWEAGMVKALVRHLCRQGKYKSGEIAVLTPYLGQLRKLRDTLEEEVELVIGERDLEDLEDSETDVDGSNSGGRMVGQKQRRVEKAKLSDGLRMATVDNFQGEEATVVIVSLVRSNMKRNCGFLKTPNRINVLLSRAKHGMYIIGDASTSSRVSMWKSVIELLERGPNIGQKLELHCSRHPDKRISVSSPEDFAIHAPEGGCAEKCGLRLDCGHSCVVKCHSKMLHGAVKCMEPCTRMRKCGHFCHKKCSIHCGKCPEKETLLLLNASNLRDISLAAVTKSRYGVTLEGRISSARKHVMIPYNVDTNAESHAGNAEILTMMGAFVSLTAPVINLVDDNSQPVRTHVPNDVILARTVLPANGPVKCAADIAGAQSLVVIRALLVHSSVDGAVITAAIIAICLVRFLVTLSLAIVAARRNILGQEVDFTEFQKYSEIEIDKDPLIFLSCGHFFTISSLDGIMELSEHYVMDPETDEILRSKPVPRVASGSAPKGCPYCRTPLREIDRYNRIVKKALLDEATRRFVMQANAQCTELMVEIENRETELEYGAKAFMPHEPGETRDLDTALETYQQAGYKLLRRIKKFTEFVKKTEQPFGKVNQLFASAVAKRQDIAIDAFKLDESVIQTGFQLRSQSFSFRVNWALFWNLDAIAYSTSINSYIREALRTKIATSTRRFVGDCTSLMTASQIAKFPQHEVEARIYCAQFSMLSLSNARELGSSAVQGDRVDTVAEVEARKREKESLEACEALCDIYPGTLGHLKGDIEKAKRLVNGGTTYTFVTTDEKRAVYKAMASQFSGTGHWYYCQNNHPVRDTLPFYHRMKIYLSSTNDSCKPHSSQWETAECPCNKLAVRNAGLPSVGLIIPRLQVSREQRIGMISFIADRQFVFTAMKDGYKKNRVKLIKDDMSNSILITKDEID
ncbi:MAG: hypothetical protein M1813_004946 [Trichoglossum hirsutum]|nr:MAG: hypothetical protein M1813_004946 [Trichoglossum hirsutum]